MNGNKDRVGVLNLVLSNYSRGGGFINFERSLRPGEVCYDREYQCISKVLRYDLGENDFFEVSKYRQGYYPEVLEVEVGCGALDSGLVVGRVKFGGEPELFGVLGIIVRSVDVGKKTYSEMRPNLIAGKAMILSRPGVGVEIRSNETVVVDGKFIPRSSLRIVAA